MLVVGTQAQMTIRAGVERIALRRQYLSIYGVSVSNTVFDTPPPVITEMAIGPCR